MARTSIIVPLLLLVAPCATLAARDVESKWLAKIIENLADDINSGCEYSFDNVSDKWIGLNGWRIETWDFTVCGKAVQYTVRFYPKDPASNQDERIEVEQVEGQE